MSQDLNTEIELLRQRMQAQTYGIRTGLEHLEQCIDAEKAGALQHIRQVALKLEANRSEIADELEALKALLSGQVGTMRDSTGQVAVEAPKPPPIEQRHSWQRILEKAAAE